MVCTAFYKWKAVERKVSGRAQGWPSFQRTVKARLEHTLVVPQLITLVWLARDGGKNVDLANRLC